MAEDRIDSLLTDNFKQEVELIKSIRPLLKSLADDIATVNKATKAAEGVTAQSTSVKELNENVKKTKQTLTELEKAQKRYTDSASLSAKQIALLNTQTAEQNRLNKETAKEYLGMNDAARKAAEEKKKEAEATKQLKEETKKAVAAAKEAAQQRAHDIAAYKQEQKEIKDVASAVAAHQKQLEADAKAAALAADAYYQLDQEHKRLERDARSIGIQFGRSSVEFRQAAAAANEVRDRLSAIDQDLGNFRRNVGNYASGVSGISQVLRELPNAAISSQAFLSGISNNIVQIADDITGMRRRNAELIAQGQASIPIWRQVAAALFSWQTAILLATTALVAYGDEIWDAIKGTDTFSDKLLKANAKIAESAATQSAELATLRARFEAVGSSMSDKREVVQELNAKFKEQVGEIKNINQAEAFFRDKSDLMIKAFELRARAAGAFNVIAEEQQKQLKLLADPTQALSGFRKFVIGVNSFNKALSKGFTGESISEIYDWDSVIQGAELADRALSDSYKLSSAALKQYIDLQKDANALDDKGGFETGGNRPSEDVAKKFTEHYNEFITAKKRELEAQKNFDAQGYQQEIDRQEQIINDETAFLEDRLTAVSAYYQAKNELDALNAGVELKELEAEQKILLQKEADYNSGKLKLTQLQYEALRSQISAVTTEIKTISERRNTEIDQNQRDSLDRRLKITTEYGEREKAALLGNLENIENYRTEDKNRELQALDIKKLRRRKYLVEVAALEDKYAKLIANDQIEYLQEFINLLSQAGVDVGELQKKVDELRNKAAAPSKNQGDPKKQAQELQAIYKDIAETTLSGIGNLAGILNDAKLAAYDRELEAIQRNGDAEIRAIENSTLTQEEKERRIQAANAATEAKRADIERKKRSDAARFARAEKAFAVAQIILKTAAAVVYQLGIGDPYTAIARSIAAGAIGAVELAAAIATPIPQYADGIGIKGKGKHKGGIALVGEAGPELVHERSGRMYVADRPTLIDLPADSRVIPEDKLLANGYGAMTPQLFQSLARQKQGGGNSAVVTELRSLKKVMQNQKRPLVKNYLSNYEHYRNRTTHGRA